LKPHTYVKEYLIELVVNLFDNYGINNERKEREKTKYMVIHKIAKEKYKNY